VAEDNPGTVISYELQPVSPEVDGWRKPLIRAWMTVVANE
jgi:hypothetical protein